VPSGLPGDTGNTDEMPRHWIGVGLGSSGKWIAHILP
jgi:hypothetical protein